MRSCKCVTEVTHQLCPTTALALAVLVLVAVALEPTTDVTPLFAAQKVLYHVLMARRLVESVQLELPQTVVTPVVPSLLNAVNRVSVQKQFPSTLAILGGVHFPWTSNRGPHKDAHTGRVDVKGTMSPSGEAVAPAAEAVVVWA
jgi:hypothetical protein